MATVILIIHLMIAVALVALVLLQRSEGGALGIGGGDGFMTGRGTGSVLTRATAILAGLFMTTSLVLGILASRGGSADSILDRVVPPPSATEEVFPEVPAPLGGDFGAEQGAPASTTPEPAAPAEPAEPVVPRAE
ncbi:MAG: preprotein translocase subunit SecG [Parvibaculum sp.]